MKVRFIAQPFTDFGGHTAAWLDEVLSQQGAAELQLAVAWAKRSGLGRLASPLARFSTRGGRTTAVIGLDEGGATRQGLELALTMFDDVYVFHDPANRTFHPKVLLVSGEGVADLLVGSNNLTAGGFYSNYEACITCHLELSESSDHELFQTVSAWIDLLLSDTGLCRPLTRHFLQMLLEDQRYQISDEDSVSVSRDNRIGDQDGITRDTPETSLFGPSMLPSTARASRAAAVRRSIDSVESRQQSPATANRSPSVTSAATDSGQLRWMKRLSRADAQRPSGGGTNPTGNLKLSKAGNAIDHKVFFRHEMFESEKWASIETRRGIKEIATVTVRVIVERADLGEHDLVVDHAEYRVAGQNNVATWLHWGATLARILQEADFVGAWVLLERRSDYTYRLELSRSELH